MDFESFFVCIRMEHNQEKDLIINWNALIFACVSFKPPF